MILLPIVLNHHIKPHGFHYKIVNLKLLEANYNCRDKGATKTESTLKNCEK